MHETTLDDHDTNAVPSRGPLAFGLALGSLLLTFMLALACPGLSFVSLAIGVASILLAFAGMRGARDTSLHISAIAIGSISVVLSLLLLLVMAMIFAFYGAMMSTMVLQGGP